MLTKSNTVLKYDIGLFLDRRCINGCNHIFCKLLCGILKVLVFILFCWHTFCGVFRFVLIKAVVRADVLKPFGGGCCPPR